MVDIKKLKPISFDPFGNAYFGVGEKVGNALKTDVPQYLSKSNKKVQIWISIIDKTK